MCRGVIQLCATRQIAIGGSVLGNRKSRESSRSQIEKELEQRHQQLTSTPIAARLCSILKGQPNMKVKSIIAMTERIFQYKIKYGKAWRAKQRAWKIIYGDWEEAYEKLPALFHAMKAANPGMHYEYIPKPNAMEAGRTTIFLACILVLPPERRGLQALSFSVVH